LSLPLSWDVPPDVDVICKKAAVLDEQIKERSCMLAENNWRMKWKKHTALMEEKFTQRFVETA
jgi:hypothetical protein